MLSGRSQSSWIQPSALNSNHNQTNKKPALHSGEFIFLQIHFLQPLFYEIIDFQSCELSGTHSSSTPAETQIQKGC